MLGTVRLGLALGLIVCFHAHAEEPRLVRTNAWSEVMRKDVPVSCVLPSAYGRDPERRWPVVYLLHGCGGDANQFLEKTGLVRKAVDDVGFIAICPDGMSSSWWMDSPVDESVRYGTFVGRELVRWTDSNFRTVADRRGRVLAGASMGGYGAMSVGIRNKDVFGSVGSVFGCMELKPFIGNEWSIAERMGPVEGRESVYDAYSALTLARSLKNGDLNLMMVIGSDDQFFVPCNRALHLQLSESGIAHDYVEIRGADWLSSSHSFECQRLCEPHLFEFIRKVLAR